MASIVGQSDDQENSYHPHMGYYGACVEFRIETDPWMTQKRTEGE